MTLTTLATIFVLPVLGISLVLAFVRLARGPSLPDRVVALDLVTTLVIAIAAVYAIAQNQPVLIDVVTVLALLSFLGTIGFAQYLEKRV